MKVCNKCGQAKPLEEFYRASGARDGHRGECIECAKEIRRRQYLGNRQRAIERATQWRLDNPMRVANYQAEYRNRPERKRAMRDLYYRRTYGLTADEVDAMLQAQGAVCAICWERPAVESRMHVDHDHATGAIRGVLCSRCNHAIGLLREDPAVFARAAAYLRGR